MIFWAYLRFSFHVIQTSQQQEPIVQRACHEKCHHAKTDVVEGQLHSFPTRVLGTVEKLVTMIIRYDVSIVDVGWFLFV